MVYTIRELRDLSQRVCHSSKSYFISLIGIKACLCLLFNQLIQSKRSKILGNFLKIRSKKKKFFRNGFTNVNEVRNNSKLYHFIMR
jgi:hypothetical protein